MDEIIATLRQTHGLDVAARQLIIHHSSFSLDIHHFS